MWKGPPQMFTVMVDMLGNVSYYTGLCYDEECLGLLIEPHIDIVPHHVIP